MAEPVILPISNTPGYYCFSCPGCKQSHRINTSPANPGPCWTLTGPPEAPTIRASVLAKWQKPDGKGGWLPEHICHSFITDGQIQFLNDCTHELAGQTVPLQP